MILGIGTDITSIIRFQQNIDEHGQRFVDKILSESEKPLYEKTNQKAQYLASRFAAKEALAKALGTGFQEGVSMPSISILHNEKGRPYFELTGKALDLAQAMGVKQLHLSISHEKEFALAFVILSAL